MLGFDKSESDKTIIRKSNNCSNTAESSTIIMEIKVIKNKLKFTKDKKKETVTQNWYNLCRTAGQWKVRSRLVEADGDKRGYTGKDEQAIISKFDADQYDRALNFIEDNIEGLLKKDVNLLNELLNKNLEQETPVNQMFILLALVRPLQYEVSNVKLTSLMKSAKLTGLPIVRSFWKQMKLPDPTELGWEETFSIRQIIYFECVKQTLMAQTMLEYNKIKPHNNDVPLTTMLSKIKPIMNRSHIPDIETIDARHQLYEGQFEFHNFDRLIKPTAIPKAMQNLISAIIKNTKLLNKFSREEIIEIESLFSDYSDENNRISVEVLKEVLDDMSNNNSGGVSTIMNEHENVKSIDFTGFLSSMSKLRTLDMWNDKRRKE